MLKNSQCLLGSRMRLSNGDVLLLLSLLGFTLGQEIDYGWITPIHGTSPECKEASNKYIASFGDANDPSRNATFGLSMLDSNGRLPLEGFLSDTLQLPIPLCEVLGDSIPNCDTLPASLTTVNVNIPMGFANNPGNMDNCLKAKAVNFRSKYCTVTLTGPDLGLGGRQGGGREAWSYPGMVANLAEKVEMMRQVRRAAVYAKGHKTISGAQDFHEHITLLQSLSQAEPSMTPQQVLNLKTRSFYFATFPPRHWQHLLAFGLVSINHILGCASLLNAPHLT